MDRLPMDAASIEMKGESLSLMCAASMTTRGRCRGAESDRRAVVAVVAASTNAGR